MWKVLEDFLVGYNIRGHHLGLNLKGQTPAQPFRDGRTKVFKGGTQKAV